MMMLFFFVLSISTIISYASVDTSLGLKEEDCPRIRRPWNTMSDTDRELYISGLLKLRSNGGGSIDNDDFVSIASVHTEHWKEVNIEKIDVSSHGSSIYFFWHGYFVWELETRIRSLGGKYKCFGMPYWDYTIEHDRKDNPFIFTTGLGGDGNPNDQYIVNGYSWKYNINKYWVPYNCLSKNDKYPKCSLKRHLSPDINMPSAQEIGDVIRDNPKFRDFHYHLSRGSDAANLFKGPLGSNKETDYVLVTSWDPTWYLLHSFISLQQALWTDCNQYDEINPNDLHKYPNAYEPYCKVSDIEKSCKGYLSETQLNLDGIMIFDDRLKNKKWSYIHSNDLTVRKRYHMDRWNIIYDLHDNGNHNSFYEESGLKTYCKGKLNPNWFTQTDKSAYDKNAKSYIHNLYNNDGLIIGNNNNSQSIYYIIIIIMLSIIGLYTICYKKNKSSINNQHQYVSYQSV